MSAARAAGRQRNCGNKKAAEKFSGFKAQQAGLRTSVRIPTRIKEVTG